MKLFSYIKYFFYIAYNWNISIARHIIMQEMKGEKKYGIDTTGADELKRLEKKGIDITHATIYMPVSYELLEDIFNQLNTIQFNPSPPAGRHFLDLGSGRGRALCVAAHKGFKKVTGIDFSKELCDSAINNLNITKQKIPSLQYEVINNDAFYFDMPDDTDCIFFFNPFDEIIMSGVVENIMTSLENSPRKILIIYVNPLHKELFYSAGFTETWYCKKMKYLEAIILEN
jgi:SAM-dependent methyltransferase